MILLSQPSNAAADAQLTQRAPSSEEYLLREVVAERGLAALSIHEAAHARMPAPHDLRERLVVARARERDHESVGGGAKLGRRQPALHLARVA